MGKYLKVEYGDNDFGLCVKLGVQRFWNDLARNNAHLLEKRTLADVVAELLRKKLLLSTIERYVDSEYIASDGEGSTRGMYRVFAHKFSLTLPVPECKDGKLRSITHDYLGLKLSIVDSVSDEWANGEEAYLCLEPEDHVIMR